jgi:sarcosine oxidase, subunit gamma
MSNSVSALGGASHTGFADVADAGLRGMITVRGDLGSKGLATAVTKVTGTAMPEVRRVVMKGDRGAAWMSPDELLVLVPYEEAASAAARLTDALAGEHALVADVSDARAVFMIRGAKADQVLRKLTPADMDALAPGEIRRTRIAQVAGAFWRSGPKSGPEEITLVTFRSVAEYVIGVMEMSARAGSELA